MVSWYLVLVAGTSTYSLSWTVNEILSCKPNRLSQSWSEHNEANDAKRGIHSTISTHSDFFRSINIEYHWWKYVGRLLFINTVVEIDASLAVEGNKLFLVAFIKRLWDRHMRTVVGLLATRPPSRPQSFLIHGRCFQQIRGGFLHQVSYWADWTSFSKSSIVHNVYVPPSPVCVDDELCIRRSYFLVRKLEAVSRSLLFFDVRTCTGMCGSSHSFDYFDQKDRW